MKVVLRGYYGKGNFGDDILMYVSFWLVRDLFPEAELFICSDSSHPDYVRKLLGDVKIVKSNERFDADLMVHGGGGVYFDFREGGLIFGLLNSLIKKIQYAKYRRLYFLIQSWRDNTGIQAKRRIGLGIGVGTYTATSRKLYADILSLIDFQYLIVRDNVSALNLIRFDVNYPIDVGSDLAFFDHIWNPSKLFKGTGSDGTIGIVLRDWPNDDHIHVRVLLEVARRLNSSGYKVLAFSFDKNEDGVYRGLFEEFEFVTWDPENMSFNDFCEKLARPDCILSSRAHGCIIPACMGVPVLCIGIEPKLASVHAMLPHSSHYISAPFEPEEIIENVEDLIKAAPHRQKDRSKDIDNNRTLIKEAMGRLRKFSSREM